jgi:hypothetical protein
METALREASHTPVPTHTYVAREFYSLRYRHNDPDRRNVIWDSKGKKWSVQLQRIQCRSVYVDCSFPYSYIIDLEDAYHINDDAKPAQFKPSIDWIDWGLEGPTLITDDGVDPMVPCHQFSLVDPGDEALLKMANDAVGKKIYNP